MVDWDLTQQTFNINKESVNKSSKVIYRCSVCLKLSTKFYSDILRKKYDVCIHCLPKLDLYKINLHKGMDDDYKIKMSKIKRENPTKHQNKQWENPEYKIKMQAMFRTKEWIDRCRMHGRKPWCDPEYRKRKTEEARQQWKSPECII